MDLNRLIEARVLHADLVAVDRHFAEIGIANMAGIVCLKSALLALANLLDFERTVRGTYKRHPQLSAVFGPIKKNLMFAKYLRNKFVGHIHPDLIAKAVERQPTLRYMAARLDDPKVMVVANIFILETVINTYVDANEKHKIFTSESDLMLPGDWKRFIDFFEVSIRAGIQYLSDVCDIWEKEIHHPESKDLDLDLWLKAGQVKFNFLTK